MKSLRFAYVGAILLALAGSAFAHHSAAMFDRDKTVELVGTIVDFSWSNPHSWITIDVPNASGAAERWSIECNSPNNMARQGWTSTTLKPGDQVTIRMHPLRNGDKGGQFISVKLADGQILTNGGGYPAPKP